MFIRYGQIGPALGSRGHEFHNLVWGFMYMHLCNHAPRFFPLHEWKQRRRFLNLWSFLHIYLCHPGVVRSQLSQFRFFLLQRGFKIKVVIMTLKFQIEHSRRTMMDQDQMQHTTCMIDSGDLKRKPLCCIYFRQKLSEKQVIVK